MIKGIGIDIVDIERFSHWHQYQSAQLQRIFSIEEIAHCLEYGKLSAGRFAVRFAAREAFFKAIQAAYPKPLPFLTCCKAVYLSNNKQGTPQLTINWELLTAINPAIEPLAVHVSLSHSKTTATAFVILETQ
jgi:holo-[acyl-carrier protein] synthase